jgi:chromosomal replication initiation ATPase DnaA
VTRKVIITAEDSHPFARLNPLPGELEVLQAICRHCNVEEADMLARERRSAQIVKARETFVGVARELRGWSYPHLARILARAHHSATHAAHKRWLKRPQDERNAITRTIVNAISRARVAETDPARLRS